ncbi:MAG: FGGY family carbohydrate kinase, partial [Balneolaceae bacterium]
EPTKDEDGYPCDDLNLLTDWMLNEFESVFKNNKYAIHSLNISTYGASLVHLDKEGRPVTPLYNYLKPYPGDLLQKFYKTHGNREQFSLETASPPMGMLNSGLQIYWLKQEKPELFKKIHYSLHFPQYLSSLFTKKYVSEMTSIGCHTGLWNFEEDHYHRWVKQEKVQDLFPPIQPVWQAQEFSMGGKMLRAGPGIHDSSAALAAYQYAIDNPFILISTGTWSITLNPFNKEPLTFEELEKDCLCYLNIHGDQVKASRFFLGNEYAHQKKKLDASFGRDRGHADIDPDPTLLKRLIKENNPAKKLELETAHSSGPYMQNGPGKWNTELFSSYEEACHQLVLDLVTIQAECIRLAEGANPIERMIVTGGFSQNELFVKLLASRFPDKTIYTSSLPYASALGAGLVLEQQADITEVNSLDLKKLLAFKEHTAVEGTGIEQYVWK